ncbi:MAG TPA: polyprenyl glycosylphosphotransferase, partial [Terracidiphilus sp.]|nr:polyprenyl glycosylphosphotransferase [Terracidiphilus sp.]
MIRLFNVYYPTRTLALLLCEALLVGGSFLAATTYLIGPDTYIALIYENGILKILGITVLTLLLSYYFDLYEPQRISGRWEIYFRLLLVLSVLCFVLGGAVYLFPGIYIGPHVLTIGIAILAIILVVWRRTYEWIIGLSAFRERVYVLGNGERARTVIETLRIRRDAGM